MVDSKEIDLFHQCAWCENPIHEDEDYYGFGAKASKDINLSNKAGQFVSLNLTLQNKPFSHWFPNLQVPAYLKDMTWFLSPAAKIAQAV